MIKKIAIYMFIIFMSNLVVASSRCGPLELMLINDGESTLSNPSVLILLKNRSNEFVEVPASLYPQDYWVRLDLSQNGKKIKFRGPELKLQKIDLKLTLRQNHFFGRTINLSKMFEIREPGKYVLSVKYGIGPDLKSLHGSCSSKIELIF